MAQKFPFNPWLKIWTSPRETIRSVINIRPMYGFFYLATIYALQSLLYFANFYSLGKKYSSLLIFVGSAILAPIVGTVWIYFYSWIIYFTGKWLKGKALFSHIRTAVAWSKVPLVINLAIWIVLLLFLSGEAFIVISTGPSSYFINMIVFICSAWSFVLLFQGIREVQHFSFWRTIGNILLTLGVSVLFLFAFFLLFIFVVDLLT